jgi:hypothetical protein
VRQVCGRALWALRCGTDTAAFRPSARLRCALGRTPYRAVGRGPQLVSDTGEHRPTGLPVCPRRRRTPTMSVPLSVLQLVRLRSGRPSAGELPRSGATSPSSLGRRSSSGQIAGPRHPRLRGRGRPGPGLFHPALSGALSYSAHPWRKQRELRRTAACAIGAGLQESLIMASRAFGERRHSAFPFFVTPPEGSTDRREAALFRASQVRKAGQRVWSGKSQLSGDQKTGFSIHKCVCYTIECTGPLWRGS